MRKIAIIMSVYKNDNLHDLKEALESLYAQTEKADIFIQQDGCLSNELESYLDIELEREHITYLGKRDENFGLAYSLNELLKKVLLNYEYIARMDADDISTSRRIELQYNFLKQNDKLDIVGGYIKEFGDGFAYEKVVKYPLEHNKMFAFFSKRVPLAHVSVMYKNSFFKKVGFYPTSSLTNEDTLMWMMGFDKGCIFANIPEILVKVRVNKDFFTRRGGLKKSWNDLKDRLMVIKVLGYNFSSYGYAFALFLINLMPGNIKKILYKRLR